jgi:hypothetical protein
VENVPVVDLLTVEYMPVADWLINSGIYANGGLVD